MAVRNWWIEADIDGRRTNLAGGPRNKDGGFELRIYQRDKGGINHIGYIYGRSDNRGNLILEGAFDGQPIRVETVR